jgi:hypothetical protein
MDMVSRHSNANTRERKDVSRTDSPPRYDTSVWYKPSMRSNTSTRRKISIKGPSARLDGSDNVFDIDSSPSYSSSPEPSSCYAIPQSSVPKRSSSFGHFGERPRGHAGRTTIRNVGLSPQLLIPNRGHGRSPVKEAGLRLDPITADTARRVPSTTNIRSPHPVDILEFPELRHPRVRLDLQVMASIFVGGGTIEGYVKITVDDNERLKQRRTLGVGTISVDLLGYEEVYNGRQATFLALGTNVIDPNHPPPANMIQSSDLSYPEDKFWTLVPSTSALPFMVSLPLDTGPPPFKSKQASIRFFLCATALIRDTGTHYRVRVLQEVQVLPTYDPEKALISLPTPLTATDELTIPRMEGSERVRITAGLHRQVWVSGSTVFVDVHIINKSRKPVKRLDLNLERNVLCYKYAAAGMREKVAGQARVFESNTQTMVAESSLRTGVNAWNGVEPHTSHTRTCDLELPRGHATVRCGKYFEVCYFLNITASLSSSKLVSVQLPIVLIHMNSIDVVPNSVAQVAAAIEEERARKQTHHRRRISATGRNPRVHQRQRSVSSPARSTVLNRKPSYTQGRAFAVARQQSLDRQRAEKADIDVLRQTLDSSPRKHPPRQLHGFTVHKLSSSVSIGNLSLGGKSNGSDSAFRAMRYNTPPSEPRQACTEGRAAEDDGSIRRPVHGMTSADTLRSQRSDRSLFDLRKENVTAERHARHNAVGHNLETNAVSRQRSLDVIGPGATQWRETGLTFRERLDRSRFEFKPVRRKQSMSSNMKERGRKWLDQIREMGRDREAWM